MTELKSDSGKNQGTVRNFVRARQKLDSKKSMRALDSIDSEASLDSIAEQQHNQIPEKKGLRNYKAVNQGRSIEALTMHEIMEQINELLVDADGKPIVHLVRKPNNGVYCLRRNEKNHLVEIHIKDFKEYRAILRSGGILIDWKTDPKIFNLCPFEDFFFNLAQELPEIEYTSEWPRFPPLPNSTHKFQHITPQEPVNKRLETFVNFFNTDTENSANKTLLWGLIVGSVWGGDGGERPVWCITGKAGAEKEESQDIGKSSLAEALLYLHKIKGKLTITQSEDRMLSGLIQNADRAIQLMDNMEEPVPGIILNAMSTSATYSGHVLKQNYMDRPAYSMMVITANTPTVESQAASRMYVVRLTKPTGGKNTSFREIVKEYIDKYDAEMIAEAHWYLSQPHGEYTRSDINNRYITFINQVLCKMPGFDPQIVASHLAATQKEVMQSDEHLDFQDYVFHRFRNYGPIKNAGKVYINKEQHKIMITTEVMRDLYIDFKKPKFIPRNSETGRIIAKLCREMGWVRVKNKRLAGEKETVYIINPDLPDDVQIYLNQSPSNTRGLVQAEFYRDPRKK